MAGLVELASPSVDAFPGEDSEIGVLVYNTGANDEIYELDVAGSVAAWSFLDPASIRLRAGASRTVRLVLRPPRAGDMPAGPVPFFVRLRSRAAPEAEEVAAGTVDLMPFEAFTARLIPDVLEVAGRAKAKVEITNDGNIPIVVHLSTDSQDGALGLKLDDETVLVQAGTTSSFSVAVKPTHRRFVGRGPAAIYSVRLESLARVATLTGRAQPKGSLPNVVLRAVLAGAVLAGAVLGTRSFLAGDDGVPTKTSKGLPRFIGPGRTSIDPTDGALTGVEEAPPATGLPILGGTSLPTPGTSGTIVQRPPDRIGPATTTPLRRFFDSALADYIFTVDPTEAATLVAAGLVDQGTAGQVLSAKANGTVALYRLRKADGRHVFTFDESERRALVVKGAVTEGTTGYLYPAPAAGTIPLYRLTLDGNPYLTVDSADVQSRVANGWVNEGVRGYVLA